MSIFDRIKQTDTIAKAQKEQGKQNPQRGFTIIEKWIIWAVFCLLIGLSTSIFVFPALLLLSFGIIMLRNALILRNRPTTVILAVAALSAAALLFWLSAR